MFDTAIMKMERRLFSDEVSRFWSTFKFSQNLLQKWDGYDWKWLNHDNCFYSRFPTLSRFFASSWPLLLSLMLLPSLRARFVKAFCMILMQKLCLIFWKICVDIFNTFSFSFWNFSSSLVAPKFAVCSLLLCCYFVFHSYAAFLYFCFLTIPLQVQIQLFSFSLPLTLALPSR